jgi:glutaredoxin
MSKQIKNHQDKLDPVTHKILKHSDKFVVFFSPVCGFSQASKALLNKHNIPFRSYDIYGKKDKIIKSLISTKGITGFDPTHNTYPIIFYKGKFVGGHSELEKWVIRKFDSKALF